MFQPVLSEILTRFGTHKYNFCGLINERLVTVYFEVSIVLYKNKYKGNKN